MNKVNIGILGSCVSREIFNYDCDNYFEIVGYINFNSIIAQMMEPSFQVLEKEIMHKNDWFSRIISTDINKNAIETIINNNPDYVMIDLMSERLDLIKIRIGEKETLLTCHNDLMDTKLFNTEDGIFKDYDIRNNIVKRNSIDEEHIEIKIRKFCEKLLSSIDINRIIFVESFKTEKYIDKNGNIQRFNIDKFNINETNITLLKMQKYLLRYLEGCHIIRFPYNTLADELHHLQLSPMHYCKNYYEYALEITKGICMIDNALFPKFCSIQERNNNAFIELLGRKSTI